MSNERCPICGDYILDGAENGLPLINEQVCRTCIFTKVIPARVDDIISKEIKNYGQQ